MFKRVRNTYRKKVKSRYEDENCIKIKDIQKIYKKRSDIERFIGIVKNRWGDRDIKRYKV